MLIQGNQQAMITSSWFVGFLEGEGNFSIPKNNSQNGRIRITNTDLDLIEACESFLSNNKIHYYTQQDAKRKNRRGKDCYTIYIKNNRFDEFYEYCNELYKLIGNKVECRKNEYDQLLGITASETIHPLTIDLDWLVGIWEAEGSFSLFRNNWDRLVYNINLVNTNVRILDKVVINLKAIGCPWYVQSRNKPEEHHKQATSIIISGFKRCKYFLDVTEGKWVSRRNKKRSTLMLEFIKSRLSKPEKETYSDREESIIQSIKDLNKFG